jgi:uncharacterized protein (TIGR02186 family)
MMKLIRLLLSVILSLVLAAPLAAAAAPQTSERVLTAASKNRIEIGLFYKGDVVHLFGANPVPGSDLIVRLTAEKDEELKLSVKGTVGPFWMTVRQYGVTGIPFVYKIHASRPIKEIVSEATAQELGLGFQAIKDRMQMHLIRGEASPNDADLVFQGILKIKQDANLYNIEEGAARLAITEGKLFSHYFRFPPAATEGVYLVETFSFQNGELVGYGKDEITIRKVGLEAWLTMASQTYPLIYGIGAVIFAMGAGLLVGVIFKKGGHH